MVIFLVILGKTPSRKTPQRFVQVTWIIKRACLYADLWPGVPASGFSMNVWRLENAHVSNESVGDIGNLFCICWMTLIMMSLWKIIHMYHDIINDSFKSRIILVLTCPHGTSRLDMWGRHQILRNGPPIALQQWRNIDHSKPRQLQERVDNWSAENSCGSMWVVNEFSLVFFGAKTRSSRV